MIKHTKLLTSTSHQALCCCCTYKHTTPLDLEANQVHSHDWSHSSLDSLRLRSVYISHFQTTKPLLLSSYILYIFLSCLFGTLLLISYLSSFDCELQERRDLPGMSLVSVPHTRVEWTPVLITPCPHRASNVGTLTKCSMDLFLLLLLLSLLNLVHIVPTSLYLDVCIWDKVYFT